MDVAKSHLFVEPVGHGCSRFFLFCVIPCAAPFRVDGELRGRRAASAAAAFVVTRASPLQDGCGRKKAAGCVLPSSASSGHKRAVVLKCTFCNRSDLAVGSSSVLLR